MRKGLKLKMFVLHCVAIETHTHTHTSSAYSSEKSVTKHLIIPLCRIISEQQMAFWLSSSYRYFETRVSFKKKKSDMINFRTCLCARLKNMTVIKPGLGLWGGFPIIILHGFLVYSTSRRRPINERNSNHSTVHGSQWLSKKKCYSFVVTLLTGLRGMQIAAKWCKALSVVRSGAQTYFMGTA